jgi:hypothetical protein
LVAGLAPEELAPGLRARLSWRFLTTQDFPILICIGVAAAFWLMIRGLASRLGPVIDSRLLRISAQPLVVLATLTILCLIVTIAGTWLVYDNYALSMDEFMANFDAAIFARGAAMAPLAKQWRPFLLDLQPMFILSAPGDWAWCSQYLPVNSLLRAIARLAGAQSLVNPLEAAISIIAVFAVGRRLWPRRPDLALAAAVLLATSSQLLVTAMTPYAMTGHLAFNLLWLWLFLRGGRLGHLGAIVVGFLACGLHQLAFHPLFVAPFVLQLFLERRWRLGALYVVAYAAICAFWASYWPMLFAVVGSGAPVAAMVGPPPASLAARVLEMLGDFSPDAFGTMDSNLIRFFTWQNLLTVPLALIGGAAAMRAGGTMRSLALGFILTTAVVFLVMPYQGHGWGYRYWHGLLGSACLLAAFAWGRMTEHLNDAGQARARAGFRVVTAISVLVLFPIRALQAHGFVHPYARAEAAIRRSRAQLVMVDDSNAWFTIDLVRNDPFLANRPIELPLRYLSLDQVRALCSRYTVDLFTAADARRFGIWADARAKPDERSALRLDALRGSCGAPPAPVGEVGGSKPPTAPSLRSREVEHRGG